MKTTIYITAMTIGLGFALPAASSAQVVVRVRPVAPKVVVVRPAERRAGWVWADGEWRWDRPTKQYVWVEGHWIKEVPSSVWVAGHWRRTRGGEAWVPGHWARRR
jgi:hypothetical protein